MVDAPEYERGDAREDVLSDELEPSPPSSRGLPDEASLFELTTEQYWTWLTELVERGSALDQELDDLLDQVYDCEPSFYSLSGRRELRALLNELHDARAAVRAYEYDVEELTYAFARSEVMETRAAENADMALSQIKATYNRAYDLCLYKMDRLGNAWITATNLLISFTILVVTILFWMEFR
jgi:hypothetical protein